jgi:hypothetical protein
MTKVKNYKAILMTGLISATTMTPLWLPLAASAQFFPPSINNRSNNNNSNSPNNPNTVRNNLIPRNAKIPVKYGKEKILVTREETVSLTLDVGANFRNRFGTVLIPYESKIVGRLEPYGNGTRFVAEELVINDRVKYPLNAVSQVITKTEQIKKGASVGTYLRNAAIGAAAAAVIAGVTGDRAIATEEILLGAGVGALGTLILGGKKVEVISIDPNKDLELTLLSDLIIN